MNATKPEPGAIRRILAFYLNGSFARFLLAGGVAAGVNFASRIALESKLGFVTAVLTAYAIGFVVAFFLNRYFVFPATGKPIRQEMAWFLVFNLIALPIVLVASVLLRDHVFRKLLPPGAAETVAHGCAILIPILFNFAAHQLVTFRPART
ncbi:MAG: GtrA family protein [Phenylobacterium sp.]|uniref:GtrA family protein n=1 Tax=Phenylobacterium sp. TaxID=1871053 RepID=UPI0027326FC8|nr:GtrA family protein [Phenylobacterium sp.]MDP3175695.1 GtrA family protein [Phenylobacterium sp.]